MSPSPDFILNFYSVPRAESPALFCPIRDPSDILTVFPSQTKSAYSGRGLLVALDSLCALDNELGLLTWHECGLCQIEPLSYSFLPSTKYMTNDIHRIVFRSNAVSVKYRTPFDLRMTRMCASNFLSCICKQQCILARPQSFRSLMKCV